VAPHAWEHHQGKIAAFWAVLVLAPLALMHGTAAASAALAHALLSNTCPSSFCSPPCSRPPAASDQGQHPRRAGGEHGASRDRGGAGEPDRHDGRLDGDDPPVLRANDDRRHNAHVVVFFIFLVSNIGGSLTPLGDPPLFLGFLRGVDFFWTTRHLLARPSSSAGSCFSPSSFSTSTSTGRKAGPDRTRRPTARSGSPASSTWP
jgi:hypothetical protein